MLARYRQHHPGSSIATLLFYDLIRESALLILQLIYRMKRVRVKNVPREGAVLLIANHQSFLDPPIVSSAIRHRHTDFLARGGLFKFKPFGWVISKLHASPIKQGAGDAGAMKATIVKMKEGKMMLVFPEGSRTEDGEMHEFQRGIAVLLKRADCTVVPVGIDGAFDAWPRTRRFPRIFTKRIVVCFGEPIESNELMSNGTDSAIETLRSSVSVLVEEAKSLR
ncbi:MAG: lysophospholipid acyltransferase family protein [Phycisphaerales bacterium]|nr:lysophospholipid acyltransferase family protein [Phycisphaerales bacterium]